jgi:hypothetical protein
MADRMSEDELAAARRSRAARIAVDTSWARTPNRTERTAKARANAPTTYEYWLRKVAEEGVRPKDQAKAAGAAHRAYMTRLSAKAAEARRKRAQSA